VQSFQRPFLQPKNKIATWQCTNKNAITLEEVVKNARPTFVNWCIRAKRNFLEKLFVIWRAMLSRPIIFHYLIQRHASEAIPDDLMRWTDGRAIIGTGSPFW